MANRNRNAGNTYEREIVNRFNSRVYLNEEGDSVPLFPTLGTTRDLSRAMDAAKIDITTVNPMEHIIFGLTIQAKTKTTSPSYPKLLDIMKSGVETYGGIPIVYHRQTKRVQKTPESQPRFMKRGEFVSLNALDFEQIYTDLRKYKLAYEEVMTYFDSINEEEQKSLNTFLTNLGL